MSTEHLSDPLRFSVARAATIRLAAEAVWAGAALFSGAVVAQQLGADGKGVAAALGYLIVLIGPLCTLGVGDASVALVRSGRVSWEDALDSVTAVLMIGWLPSIALFVGAAAIQFRGLFAHLDGSVFLGSLSIPLLTAWTVLTLFVEARGWMYVASLAKIAVGATTAVMTVVLVMKTNHGIAGAIAAGGMGFGAGAAVLLGAIVASGVVPRPRLRATRLADVVRLGIPIQFSLLLVGASSRADLLLVQGIAGGGTAGRYSVALTASQLVSYGSVALSSTAFPVVAGLADPTTFIERIVRTSVAVSLAMSAALAAVLPVAIPLAFGGGFARSVPLTYVLIPSGAFYGTQWILTRAWAAAGHPEVLVWSFGLSTGTMLIGDVLLIGPHGAAGAAIAATVSSAIGAVVAVRWHRRLGGGGIRTLAVPRRSDLPALRSLYGRGAPRSS